MAEARFYTAHRHPEPPALIVYNGPFLHRETAEAEAAALAEHGQPGAVVIEAASLSEAVEQATAVLRWL